MGPLSSESATPASPAGILTQPLPTGSGGAIAVWEVTRGAFGNLLANKIRSFLTMLGVIIGVASVVSLLAIGNGASASITDQVSAIGTNMLTIAPGRSQRGPGVATAAQSLTLNDAAAIAALRLPVVGVAPSFSSNTQLVAAAADISASVVGVTPAYQAVNNLIVEQGAFIDAAQVRGVDPVIVLGATLARNLFGDGQKIGQTVRINNQTLRVIGVLELKGGSAFGSNDDRAFVPISVAQRRLFSARTPDGNNYRLSSITLSALNSDDIDAIQARVTVLLRERHKLKLDGSSDDFNVSNQAELLDTLSSVTGMLTLFLAAIAGISLLVGGIGIMNIMLVSVTERTREIGLRKAVGARNYHILLQFVVEALALSLTGGVLGLALGCVAPLALTLSGVLSAPVQLGTVVMAVGFSLAVGLFFGIYPAHRASRLNPIDALRHE
jgi:putative ABC transport system permease protein